MNWKKKDECITVESVVQRNVGMNISEFLRCSDDIEITNIDKAAKLLVQAIKMKQQITIVGDYDCDGITASTILFLTFKKLGIISKVRLPKRFSEGYGISEKIIDEINEGLIITVDNGISAHNAIAKAKDKGLDIIVIDHHQPTGELPPANIIVDPHCVGKNNFSDYCGAGLALELSKKLIIDDELFIEKMTGIAAIGTIADIVPLIKNNRKIVIDGLKAINKGNTTSGLKALLSELKISEIDETKIGYTLAPALNAPGRLLDNGATLSFRLLASESNDLLKLSEVSRKIISLNNERKDSVKSGLEKAKEQIKNIRTENKTAAVLYIPNINEGIVGILAGQIAEDLHRPTIVFTDSKSPEEIKGSGRTYRNINLKALLDKTNEKTDCILKYGGHPCAAGLTIKKSGLKDFENTFVSQTNDVSDKDFDTVFYDLEISQEKINDYYKELQKYRPFGAENSPVTFVIKNFKPSTKFKDKYRNIGETSIKIFGKNNDALGFDMTEKFKPLSSNRTWDLLGELSENTFNNKTTVQFLFRDIK